MFLLFPSLFLSAELVCLWTCFAIINLIYLIWFVCIRVSYMLRGSKLGESLLVNTKLIAPLGSHTILSWVWENKFAFNLTGGLGLGAFLVLLWWLVFFFLCVSPTSPAPWGFLETKLFFHLPAFKHAFPRLCICDIKTPMTLGVFWGILWYSSCYLYYLRYQGSRYSFHSSGSERYCLIFCFLVKLMVVLLFLRHPAYLMVERNLYLFALLFWWWLQRCHEG